MEYDLELLSGLYGVESLKLDGNVFKETMEGELPKCPTFLKLKKLTLGTSCMYCNFVLVSSFLKHCSNLEFLTLLHRHKYLEDGHIRGETSEDLLQVERFGCNRLKKIEILISRCSRHVDQLKQLLLQSTMGIKDLQISQDESTHYWSTFGGFLISETLFGLIFHSCWASCGIIGILCFFFFF